MLNFMTKKQFTLFIIVVIILALVGGGIFWYWNKYQGVSIKGQGGGNQPAEIVDTEDLSSMALATEDWQTYRNEEYGFEVKYPREWLVDQKKNFICLKTKTEEIADTEKTIRACNVSVNIYSSLENLTKELGGGENKEFFSLEEWLNYKINNYIFAGKKIIYIDNNKGYSVTPGIYSEGVSDKFVFIESGDFIYELTVLDQGMGVQKELLSVIENIKFIK